MSAVATTILTGVLAEVGAPLLKRLIEKALPGRKGEIAGTVAGEVVDTLARELGTPATPEAIKDAYDQQPRETAETIRRVEARDSERWIAYLEAADANRAALLAREDDRGFFHSGWRPFFCWMLAFLYLWNGVLVPLINAGFRIDLPIMPWNELTAFAGIWLVIYGGGHTAKAVFAKGAA